MCLLVIQLRKNYWANLTESVLDAGVLDEQAIFSLLKDNETNFRVCV